MDEKAVTNPVPLVVHVEDDSVYGMIFRRRFVAAGVRYVQVGLLAQADDFVEVPEARVFIVDLMLPSDVRTDDLQDSESLIELIRAKRPDAAICVLTNFRNSEPMAELLRKGVLVESDIFSKADLDADLFVSQIMRRVKERQSG